MELFKASRQWAERPDDERFGSLAELHAFTSGYRQSGATALVAGNGLRAVAEGGEVLVNGSTGTRARLTNWSFGQLSRMVGAPADYLAGLPAELAATNLQHGLERVRDERMLRLLFHRNGDLLVRAATSDRYTRIWNSDITRRLLVLAEDGWRVPPARPARANQRGTRPATQDDLLNANRFGLSVNVGDMIAPAGLYAGDRDMFAFMVDPNRSISDGGGDLFRGFFAWNSEVGSSAFGVMFFLWKNVCGNHIVWGAKNVHEVRIRHVGEADDRAFAQLSVEVRRYAESSASDDEARIDSAKRYTFGKDKDEVLDSVFGLKVPGLTREAVKEGYALAEVNYDTDGDPRSAWGLFNGVTRYSQTLPYADARVAMDRAAGKLLEVAF